MALLKILTYPDPVLREPAQEIEEITDEIRKLASDMAQTMYAAPGIGLAAPQIGQSLQMVTIDMQDEETGGKLYTLINPKIVKRSEETQVFEEGCLSLPTIREDVERSSQITLVAKNLDGEEITIEADDYFATCIQHELDHLNGRLLIDHLSKLKQGVLKKKLKKIKANEEAP